jgi:hypothetical protein
MENPDYCPYIQQSAFRGTKRLKTQILGKYQGTCRARYATSYISINEEHNMQKTEQVKKRIYFLIYMQNKG